MKHTIDLSYGIFYLVQGHQKWVSAKDLIKIGKFDHYVVFGIEFGAKQPIQRGKKSPVGVQQTSLDPPLASPQTL